MKPMSAFIQFSWHHVIRELGFSIKDCCFGMLAASPPIADWNTRTVMLRKHSRRWVRGVYWWPPGEAKSAAWIQLVCSLHRPVPSCPSAWCHVPHTSDTVTCPWLSCGTSGALFPFCSSLNMTGQTWWFWKQHYKNCPLPQGQRWLSHKLHTTASRCQSQPIS